MATENEQAASATLDALQTGLAREGGAVTLSCRRGEWVAGIHFGEEEPDNPDNDMAAGAAYGMGDTLIEALTAAVDETGWKA